MLNFEEELEKFQPSLEVEKVEEVVYGSSMTDVTDLIKDLFQESRNTI